MTDSIAKTEFVSDEENKRLTSIIDMLKEQEQHTLFLVSDKEKTVQQQLSQIEALQFNLSHQEGELNQIADKFRSTNTLLIEMQKFNTDIVSQKNYLQSSLDKLQLEKSYLIESIKTTKLENMKVVKLNSMKRNLHKKEYLNATNTLKVRIEKQDLELVDLERKLQLSYKNAVSIKCDFVREKEEWCINSTELYSRIEKMQLALNLLQTERDDFELKLIVEQNNLKSLKSTSILEMEKTKNRYDEIIENNLNEVKFKETEWNKKLHNLQFKLNEQSQIVYARALFFFKFYVDGSRNQKFKCQK